LFPNSKKSYKFLIEPKAEHFPDLILWHKFPELFHFDFPAIAIPNQGLCDEFGVIFLCQVQPGVDESEDLVEIVSIDFHVPVGIIEPKEVLVLLFDFSPHMEDRDQIEKQLKIDPFGLGLLHLLLKRFTQAGVQDVLPQEGDLLEVLQLYRFYLFLVQRREELLQEGQLPRREGLDLARLVPGKLGLVFGPFARLVFYLGWLAILRTHSDKLKFIFFDEPSRKENTHLGRERLSREPLRCSTSPKTSQGLRTQPVSL